MSPTRAAAREHALQQAKHVVAFRATRDEPQASLELPATGAPLTRPCTDCAKLNVGGFCSRYQRVMPEPSTPTACVHHEQREPDVPWQ